MISALLFSVVNFYPRDQSIFSPLTFSLSYALYFMDIDHHLLFIVISLAICFPWLWCEIHLSIGGIQIFSKRRLFSSLFTFSTLFSLFSSTTSATQRIFHFPKIKRKRYRSPPSSLNYTRYTADEIKYRMNVSLLHVLRFWNCPAASPSMQSLIFACTPLDNGLRRGGMVCTQRSAIYRVFERSSGTLGS